MAGTLFNDEGHRKYLTPDERRAILAAAKKAPRDVRTFVEALVYAGPRISEALALTADRVDLSAGLLVFETLKQHRAKKTARKVFRGVPVPPTYLDDIDLVHGIRELQAQPGRGRGVRLWAWSRTTAWRRVKEVLDAAGIDGGVHQTAKGLRHAFAIAALDKGIPLNLVQRWLGHAQLTTTAIYAEALGAEEKNIAARMWAAE